MVHYFRKGGQRERFYIFMSGFQAEKLCKCDLWPKDGTFKSCTSGFYQLLPIQGFIYGKCFQFAFILLTSKQESLYTTALTTVGDKIDHSPCKFITDFEKALINACSTCFPVAKLNECSFHFEQAAYRYLKNNCGLSVEYKAPNSKIKIIFRKLLNLSFFPVEKVKRELTEIVEQSRILSFPSATDNFLRYFERNYIGKIFFFQLGGVLFENLF